MALKWQERFLPLLYILDPQGDYDRDGLNNLMEYATGQDLLAPSAGPTLIATVSAVKDPFSLRRH